MSLKDLDNNLLQRTFLMSKIKADPYDYKISNKIVPVDEDEFWRNSIYSKNVNSEHTLAKFILDGAQDNYKFSDTFGNAFTHTTKDATHFYLDRDCDFQVFNGATGCLELYNNVYIHTDFFEKLMGYLVDFTGHSHIESKEIVDKHYLEAYLTIFNKCTSKKSISAYLIHTLSALESYNLNDLVNATYVNDYLAKGIAPLFLGARSSMQLRDSRMLEFLHIPMQNSKIDLSRLNLEDSHTGLTGVQIDETEQLLKIGLHYTIAYGCEWLYQYEQITDPDIKTTLDKMLKVNWCPNGFISNLYSVENGDIVINPEVKNLFNTDNSKRFENIKNYVNKVQVKENLQLDKTSIVFNENYYTIPTIFAVMLKDLHTYAIQRMRVDIISSLYATAVSKGFLNSDTSDFNDTNGMPLSALGGLGFENVDVEHPNDMMNLQNTGNVSVPVSSEDNNFKSKGNYTDVLEELEALSKTESINYRFDFTNYKNKSVSESQKDAYKNIVNSVRILSLGLIKQIREIKTYNTGGKQSGMSRGKLDSKNLYRYKTDHKIFYNNNYKLKEMDLAFGIILDASGSMSGTGIQDGRVVMILLHEVLNALSINHCIVAHNSEYYNQVNVQNLYHFKEHKDYSLDVPYGIMNITASGCNCDSGVLKYVQTQLEKTRNKDRICLIFSDGSPTHCDNSDLRNQIKIMEKKGIHVIGIGINFESIKNYYSDYANGKNLKEMIDIVVKILKRYVLEKKD